MVSTIKYRSFKDLKFRGGRHITYLVWGILALVLVAARPQVMLFVIFAGYALLGPAERLVGLLVKTAGKRPSTKTEQSVTESKF
jgi:CDP-diacylglycerol--serine O-phosphatidyltransferase